MPVKLAVVQPERRLIRAHENITARVAPDAEVAACVECAHWHISVLEGVLESDNVRAGCDLREKVIRLQEFRSEVIVHVAAMTARVVPIAISRARVRLDAQPGVHSGSEWTKVHGQADEIVSR